MPQVDLIDLLEEQKQEVEQVEPAAKLPQRKQVKKSSNAMKTIGETAEILDVPQHVLRFWESKFPEIKPLKRNGGRRYYRNEDVELLQTIKHLLYKEGFTIKGAKKALRTGVETPVDKVDSALDVVQELDQTVDISPEKRKKLEELRSELASLRDMLQEAI
jgi:DNA-binding transcriptional MerR regulator